MENWILRRIRISSANVLGVWGLALLAIGLGVVLSWRYWDNFLHGPFELTPAELEPIKDISKAPRYYARVTGTKLQDTSVIRWDVLKENGVETGRSIGHYYFALTIGDKLLIVETPVRLGPWELTQEGVLEALPADVDKELFDFPDNQDIRRHFYPFYLAPKDFREPGYVAIFLLFLFSIFLLGHVTPVLRRLIDPTAHPAAKRAASWGTLDVIAPDVERELGSPRILTRTGWTITDSFIIQTGPLAFDLFRFSDLLWAYGRSSVQRSILAPVWTSSCADLIGLGGSAFIKTDPGMVNAILDFAARRAPWAHFGYSSEIQSRILKDKERFCREVEERKRGMTSC